jgi:hypothetical protein
MEVRGKKGGGQKAPSAMTRCEQHVKRYVRKFMLWSFLTHESPDKDNIGYDKPHWQ